MITYPQEKTFEQGLKDSIEKLNGELQIISKTSYRYQQTFARIQVFKRALELLKNDKK